MIVEVLLACSSAGTVGRGSLLCSPPPRSCPCRALCSFQTTSEARACNVDQEEGEEPPAFCAPQVCEQGVAPCRVGAQRHCWPRCF